MFLSTPRAELIGPCIHKEGIFGSGFSGEMEKIICITVFRAKMESIFCWTALTSANILLCLLPPTHGLQFPSIFWIGFGFGWQPAGSLSRAGAGEPRGCHLFSCSSARPWGTGVCPCLAESASPTALLPLSCWLGFTLQQPSALIEHGAYNWPSGLSPANSCLLT